MVTDPLRRRRARRLTLTIGAILAVLGVSAASGSASAGSEQPGARLLERLRNGEQGCQRLSREQFESIGEYVMGRMVGSPAAHEAIDRRIRARTGASGEVRAHVFMGRRFAGCATGAAPAAFGAMMGMMGDYSGAAGGGTSYGRDGGSGFGPGMMGGWGRRAGGDDGWSAADSVSAILLAVLAAALAALAVRRLRRRTPLRTPLDILSDRYARGDMDTAEYELRRHALESSA